MKSSSDVRPAIILPLGNGSYHYNYNIVEEKVEDPETGEKTVYNYDTVQVWQKPDYENLTRAVIRSEIDETEEFSLINDYYAAQLGIETGEDRKAKAVADYKAHLSRVIAIKTMVKNDLLTEGYYYVGIDTARRLARLDGLRGGARSHCANLLGILGDGYFHRYVLRAQGGEGGRGRTAKQEVPSDVQQNRGLHTGYGIRPHV